ncbi:MAG: DUF2062 domain-containing protein [Bacteroidetes bacterium]|nr:DUF2062 domain-containing protein [Bacteroidota bacterium]
MKKYLQKKLLQPLTLLLKQGISPSRLSLAVTFGTILAIIPLFGSSTILCLIAIAAFRLNPLAIMLVNQLAYPLQFALYIPFMFLGEKIFNTSSFSVSIGDIFELFSKDPAQAISLLFWPTLHALTAWVIIGIPLFFILFHLIKRIILKLGF